LRGELSIVREFFSTHEAKRQNMLGQGDENAALLYTVGVGCLHIMDKLRVKRRMTTKRNRAYLLIYQTTQALSQEVLCLRKQWLQYDDTDQLLRV